MNAHPSYEELNDHAEGVSDAAVGHHVSSCADCSETVMQIVALRQAARDLPRSLTPPPDIWESIRASIGEPRLALTQRRQVLWSMRYQLAAAAVVLLVLGSALTFWVTAGREQPIVAQATPQHANLAAYREAEAGYNKAVEDLLRVLADRRAVLDTAVVRSVEENLLTMDQAINSARAALLSDPANQDVAGILVATHELKLRMLRRAVGASGT